ncbi:MAG: hypothetical protein WCT19_01000 [Candidatus Paceibacterota bacterium]
MVSTQRKEELEAACKKGAPWGASIRFLDSINSVEELDELAPLLKEASRKDSEPIGDDLILFYRKDLTRWMDPKLEDWFKRNFPLVAAKLDTPQKIRVFLRAAAARQEYGYPNVSVSTLASVFEDIIRKHEVDGQKVVRYDQCRGSSWRDALRIVYHTELQFWTVTNMMLPERHSSGTSFGDVGNGLFIDWRTKEEKEAAGERW